MSNSKVIWSSPEINRNRKIKTAKFLNDSSLLSLKFQIVIFLMLILEIYFSLFQKLLKIDNKSLDQYKLICRTLLCINSILLVCYVFQIIQAKYIIFITNDNKFSSIVKTILFNVIPNLQFVYDKLVHSKFFSFMFNKALVEQEKERVKEIEERRKILTKSNFPSMLTQYGNYNDHYRPMESFVAPPPASTQQHFPKTPDYNLHKPIQASTPFNQRRVGSITFGGDITPIQSPMPFPDISLHAPSHYPSIKYHPSTPSPPRIAGRYSPGGAHLNKSQPGLLDEVPLNEVWKRLGIDCRLLNDWTFSLRQWIHGTIITRVVTEIDMINQRFTEVGINDVVIGESNVQTLRQLTTNNQMANSFPTLGALINFLDCCKDQAYVVNRVKELSQGCSLGKFQWDGGSTNVRHPWKEHLPNDTMLVLHLLCTYIEIKCALHSNLHGVRTFSQQFITDNVLNRDMCEVKDAFFLLQASVQPPHFKAVFNQAVYEIPAGRNNLFHCLLAFFHKVYHNDSNFKWLNLGRSGMNVNYIFDK